MSGTTPSIFNNCIYYLDKLAHSKKNAIVIHKHNRIETISYTELITSSCKFSWLMKHFGVSIKENVFVICDEPEILFACLIGAARANIVAGNSSLPLKLSHLMKPLKTRLLIISERYLQPMRKFSKMSQDLFATLVVSHHKIKLKVNELPFYEYYNSAASHYILAPVSLYETAFVYYDINSQITFFNHNMMCSLARSDIKKMTFDRLSFAPPTLLLPLLSGGEIHVMGSIHKTR